LEELTQNVTTVLITLQEGVPTLLILRKQAPGLLWDLEIIMLYKSLYWVSTVWAFPYWMQSV